MLERIIEMSSYHAILGCVSVGMGIALMPRSVFWRFRTRTLYVSMIYPPGRIAPRQC